MIDEHRKKITREYMRQLAKFLKEGRWTEAENLNIRFSGIIRCWEIQEALNQAKALKDGSAAQRESWKGKQGYC